MEGCPHCQAEMARLERLDEKIGQVCRDVSVPLELRERLLASLEIPVTAAEPVTTTAPTASVDGSRPMTFSRRRWFPRAAKIAVAVAGAASVPSLWFVLHPAPPKVDVHDLAAVAAEIAPAALSQWSGSPAPRMPVSMETSYILGSPQPLPGGAGLVWIFQIYKEGERKVEGRLVSIPVGRLTEPPKAMGFRNGSPFYTGRGFCYSTWVEGEFAFICLVEGDLQDLMILRPYSA